MFWLRIKCNPPKVSFAEKMLPPDTNYIDLNSMICFLYSLKHGFFLKSKTEYKVKTGKSHFGTIKKNSKQKHIFFLDYQVAQHI